MWNGAYYKRIMCRICVCCLLFFCFQSRKRLLCLAHGVYICAGEWVKKKKYKINSNISEIERNVKMGSVQSFVYCKQRKGISSSPFVHSHLLLLHLTLAWKYTHTLHTSRLDAILRVSIFNYCPRRRSSSFFLIPFHRRSGKTVC